MTKEIYIENNKEFSVKVVNTAIDSIREKEIKKTGLRIYKDGLIGISGTLGEGKIKELEKRSRENLKYKLSYPYEISKNNKTEIDKTNILKMDNERLLEEMEIILEYLREDHSDFIFSGGGRLISYENSLKNDNGLNLIYRDKLLALSFLIKDKNSANLIDGYTGYGGRKYNRKKTFNLIDGFCSAFKNKVEIKKDKYYPIIFYQADDMIFQKLAAELHGMKYGTKSSLLYGKLGQKIFSDDFTLYQTLNPNESYGGFFDMEGIVNKNYRYTFIENGVFRSPYTDKKTAKLFNLSLTGSAGGGYDSVPQLSYLGFQSKPSKKTLKELLGGKKAIFIIMASGGDFTPEGNFSYPVQLSFLYDGGKFIGRLPELSISSNLFEMFGKAYIGTAKDIFFPLSIEKPIVIDMKVK
jgi:PmbA protein